MIKNVLYITLFFFSSYCFGQSKDTIFLEEVKIEKISKKIKHVKTKGKTSSLSGNPIKSIISRIDQIPSGKLSSIKFYFNSNIIFFIPDSKKKDYKDVEFGLLIYEVKEDGTPGEAIIDKEIRFTLRADHEGSIELDLTPLYVETSKSMYFGIELSKQQLGNDFSIMLKCDETNPNVLFIKNWKNDNWSGMNFGDGNSCKIKTDLKISVKN